ncbi:hypothetical protein [Anthocerotibacter panamensis]|uniref:hypothetical protein n=1 Tax=Anthocerotibacter panamensis TaxID=2857077 RepID=UPI001FDA1C93|nr:hypothetical protein [Anthocerotibacter panamensis]
MVKHLGLVWLVTAAVALPVQAGTFTYTGDTTGGLTFNRPEVSPINGAITGLSPIAQTVPYQAQGFLVSAAGVYTFTSDQLFDGFLVLYQGTFDPADSLVNALTGNDDAPSAPAFGFSNRSALNALLSANTRYFLVTTGFSSPTFGPADAGFYQSTIAGPGTISPVPEPFTVLGTLAFGLWSVGRSAKK